MSNKKMIDGIRIATQYYKLQQQYKNVQKEYEEKRQEYFKQMSECFGGVSNDDLHFVSRNGKCLNIARVEPKKIIWNVAKLKKSVPTKIQKKIIKKDYKITNMQGLKKYLKCCGVNPNEFRKYIEVVETVDEKEVQQLGDLGELSLSELSGCYDIKVSQPYYRVAYENEK